LNILALDTSSSFGTIAVAKNDRLIYLSVIDIQATHSERLMPQIDYGMKMAQLSMKDLDLICVGNGPGSFTGIRIGLATAKGLCLGNDIPLLPFNTLAIIANNLYKPQYPVLVLLDAKMNEVYGALYSPEMEIIIPPQNAEPAELFKQIQQKVIITGDGVARYKSVLEEQEIEFETVLAHQNILYASTMIGLVLHQNIIPKYDFDFIADLEPYYLRRSQAEIIKARKSAKEN
jgi:tRNA threonylcarbamoyladenosine biosynthesis protein TsaB